MDHEHARAEDPGWVAAAETLEPPAVAEAPPARRRDARRALVLAILGVACLGFVFGPLAILLAERVRLAIVAGDDAASADAPRDAAVAHTALTLGRVGLALHLTVLVSALPWLLFALPLVMNAGR